MVYLLTVLLLHGTASSALMRMRTAGLWQAVTSALICCPCAYCECERVYNSGENRLFKTISIFAVRFQID